MKVIELGPGGPAVGELLRLAEQGPVLLREPDGSTFALSRVDEFEAEAEVLKNDPAFMAELRRLSGEEATIPLKDLRAELGL